MKNSGKISWVVAVIATLVVLLLAGALFYVNSNNDKLARQAKVDAYGSLVAVVENFHTQFKEDLSPSVTGKAALQDQLRKMKIMAETYTDTVQELEVKAGASGNTASLGIAIDKVDKYLKGYKELANTSIKEESLQIKAKAMVDALKDVAQGIGSTKTLDEGDVNGAIDRGVEIAAAFIKVCKPAPEPVKTTVVVTGSRYWSNPEYGDYYRTIQRIVGQYSAGRSALNTCLTHYDNHTFSSYDSTVWSREVNRRQQLLNDLSSVYGEIPSGTIYAEHHRMLEGMISSALSAMRSFANNQNDYNRRELSRVSANNTRTMTVLKRFYGIR